MKAPLTDLIAFRAHAAYCYDHRYDDDPDEFGNVNAAPVLLPFTLKNNGGEYEGKVFGTDDQAIIVHVAGRGMFRWTYDQIELPTIFADMPPETLRDALNATPHRYSDWWTVQFMDIFDIWREVSTISLNPGLFDHDGITLYEPQGDLDSGVDHMYGDVDSREFGDGTLNIPYNRILTIAHERYTD